MEINPYQVVVVLIALLQVSCSEPNAALRPTPGDADSRGLPNVEITMPDVAVFATSAFAAARLPRRTSIA
jgi:hypothetical protein